MPRRPKPEKNVSDPARPEPSPTVPGGPPSFADRWWGKLLLAVLAVVMLTLTFPPFEQFYLAYVGIVPVLLIVRHSRSGLRAVLWTWVAGALFFAANCYWLLPITQEGVAALVPVLAAYWAGAALVLWPVLRNLRPAGDRSPAGSSRPSLLGRLFSPRAWALVLVPVAWVGQEWLRGTWPWGAFPWHFVGHTQMTDASLVMCQVADLVGEAGVTAWVALVNALVLLFVVNRWRVRGLLRPVTAVVAVTAAVAAYGFWRLGQYDAVTVDGPVVMVVQPNYRQDNTGAEPRTPQDEITAFHKRATAEGLGRALRGPEPVGVDLVAWPETMMPALNKDYVNAAPGRIAAIDEKVDELRAGAGGVPQAGRFNATAAPVVTTRPASRPANPPSDGRDVRDLLAYRAHLETVLGANAYLGTAARNDGVSFLVGGAYQEPNRRTTEADAAGKVGRGNAAYFYPRGQGRQSAEPYLKIHLVPFGEFFPFSDSWPWLHRLLVKLGPPNLQDYHLDRGERAVVFDLARDRGARPPGDAGGNGNGAADAPWRFVTPICFEDVDGDLCAWLVRGGAPRGSASPKKADFLVNITNDGWFRGGQMAQHFQIARFRSIENRVPTARAVNTGISGFIDSMGRVDRSLTIPVGTEGTKHHRLKLDGRVTVFTTYGNLFGPACGILCGLVVLDRVRRKVFV
ncbi:MAG TPA: hypothetical protein VF796_18215, partial [Humisphaera sp.]